MHTGMFLGTVYPTTARAFKKLWTDFDKICQRGRTRPKERM